MSSDDTNFSVRKRENKYLKCNQSSESRILFILTPPTERIKKVPI